MRPPRSMRTPAVLSRLRKPKPGTMTPQITVTQPPNESRISCVLERPQAKKTYSARRGRSGTTASCAG
jgi:hypothetical protein